MLGSYPRRELEENTTVDREEEALSASIHVTSFCGFSIVPAATFYACSLD
jgi:hypothetical protein